MKRINKVKIFVFFMSVSTMLLLSVLALLSERATANRHIVKIEPRVIDELESNGTTDFFVWLSEWADLSAANRFRSKTEKRQYVYDTVRNTAERTQAQLREFLDSRSVRYRPFYIANKILIYKGDLELLYHVASRSDVDKITANHQYQVLEPLSAGSVINQPSTIEPNLTFVNADDVWALNITGQGTVVGGNDTGIDETHPALKSQYRGCVDPPLCSTWDHDYNWWDATDTCSDNPCDDNNHGTYTSGIMVGDDNAGNQIGMAPGARVVHCKMITEGGSTDDAMILECLEWDLAPWDLNHQNPDISMAPDAVNNAWGLWDGGQDQFRDEITTLQMAGTVMAFATGGEGPGCATLRSPADYHEVLTVGGVDHSGGVLPGIILAFSARGPSILDPSPPFYFPDVTAPGFNIRSSVPDQGYDVWSGTSASVSHAPGLVALCWSASPVLMGDVYTTMDIIKDSAFPLTGQNGSNCGGDYEEGPNNDWGFGTIDALETVNACIAASGTGGLVGTVTDVLDSSPLENATVTAVSETGIQWPSSADASGFYMLTVPSGTYTVTAEYPLYTTVITSGVEITSSQIMIVDFELMQQGHLNGYVTDFTDGSALDATVQAGVWITGTNPIDGYYELFLDEGQYQIEASADGYITQTVLISLTGGTNVQQDFELIPEDFPIFPTASFITNSPVFLGETAVYTSTSDLGYPPEAIFHWDFGDTLSSTLENPDHLYIQDGIYTVTFEVCNSIGCDTDQAPFEVLELPVADLTVEKIDLVDPVTSGEDVAYQVTIVNQGPEDALNVVLTDLPEYNYDLVTASAGCGEDVGKIVCVYPKITSGSEITIVIVLDPIDVAEILMNQVTITSDSQDTYPEDNIDLESTMVLMDPYFHILIPIVLR